MIGGQVWDWITRGSAHLFGAFKAGIGTLGMKLLGTFGLTIVSFKTLLPELKSFVMQYANLLPAETLNFLGYLGVGEAMSMVFSALTISLAARVFVVPKTVADTLPGGGAP